MERRQVITNDGSHTIRVGDGDLTYHSIHGAIRESRHVFLAAGLDSWLKTHPGVSLIAVFEMGFGTGLNALLTWGEAERRGLQLSYTTVEKYPLSADEFAGLNYSGELAEGEGSEAVLADRLLLLHQLPWAGRGQATTAEDMDGSGERPAGSFHLVKLNADLLTWIPEQSFDLVFFDAFAPTAQPELWTIGVFKKLYDAMNDGGILTTYCSKGDVRRAMLAAGFSVEKIPGPPHKREMLRATKHHPSQEKNSSPHSSHP